MVDDCDSVGVDNHLNTFIFAIILKIYRINLFFFQSHSPTHDNSFYCLKATAENYSLLIQNEGFCFGPIENQIYFAEITLNV